MAESDIISNNNFSGGLQTGIVPEVSAANTAYDIYGMRIVSNGSNSYALENIKGTKFSFTLNPNYQPIGFRTNGNKLFVFSHNNTLGRANGEIGYAVLDYVTRTGAYFPLYNHEGLNFDRQHPVECRVVKENSKTERLYFWDNKLPPRVLNAEQDTFTKHIPNGTLVAGVKYMVIQGAVTYEGVDYGVNELQGTVFTATVTGTTAYTDKNVIGFPAVVIAYYDINQINFQPDFPVGDVCQEQIISGSLSNGMYSVFFQLENAEGKRTPFSMPTRAIHIEKATSDPTVQGWLDYGGDGGEYDPQRTDISTPKGVRWRISGIDTNYSIIRVGYMKFSANAVHGNPIIFAEQDISGETMFIDMVSNDGLEELIIDDVALQPLIFIKNKAGEVVNNILFLGNVTTNDDINVPNKITGALFTPLIRLEAADLQNLRAAFPRPDYGNQVYGNEEVSTGIGGTSNGSYGTLVPFVYYEVVTATPTPPIGVYVTYNGVDYAPNSPNGDLFQCTTAVTSVLWTTVSGYYVGIRPVIVIKQYNGKIKRIPYDGQYHDYKDPAHSMYYSGYWRGNEVYRFGLLLHGKKGQAYYVRHLGDWTTPKISDPSYGTTMAFSSGTILRHMGLTIDNIDFNQIANSMGISLSDLPNYFNGFSIVRCRRDAKIIAQGYGQPIISDNGNRLDILPGTTPSGYSASGTSVGDEIISDGCMFYSPDINLQWGSADLEIRSGDSLEYAGLYTDFAAPDYITHNGTNYCMRVSQRLYGSGSNIDYYTILNTPIAQGASPKVMPFWEDDVNAATSKDLDVGFTDFDAEAPYAGKTFHNEIQYNSTFSGKDPLSYSARGRLLFTKNNHIHDPLLGDGNCHFAFSITENDVGDSATRIHDTDPNRFTFLTAARPVFNYKRNKVVLYGGNTDAALANNEYISTNHYQLFDTDFMNYLLSATEPITATPKSIGVINGIEVWGGDCYLSLFDITERVPSADDDGFTKGVIISLETSINQYLRQGRTYGRVRGYDDVANINGIGMIGTTPPVEQPEAWIYNNVYHAEFPLIAYPALPLFYKLGRNEYPRRAYYSGKKRDGERVDQYRVFGFTGYIEVGNQQGQINNLRSGDENRLIAIQDYGICVVPVNERTSIPVSFGESLSIGEGAVAERYSTIDGYLGSQHKWSLVDTPDGYVAYDAVKKIQWFLGKDLSLTPLNKNFDNHNLVYDMFESLIITSDNPLDKAGIHGVYDNKFGEVVMTFNYPKVTNSKMTLAFSMINKFYAGKYPFFPCIYHLHHDIMLSAEDAKETPLFPNRNYFVGDICTERQGGGIAGVSTSADTIEYYVCIADYNSGVTPVAASSDTDHWAYVRRQSDIFAHNHGDYNKFYGIVEPEIRVGFVVNEKYIIAKFFNNFEFTGNDKFFTDVICMTHDQVAQDNNITLQNKDYGYVDGRWEGSVPLTQQGQTMVGKWMKVLLKKNMRVNGSPVISNNEYIYLLSVLTKMIKSW